MPARRPRSAGWLVVGFGWLALAAAGQEAGPPLVDTRDMEPQVGELLARLAEEVQARPEDAAGWLEYGETLHAHGLVTEAAASYRAALKLLPLGEVTRLTAGYLLAHAVRGSDPAEAAKGLAAAVEEHPGYPPAQVFLGELREELGDRARAATAYRQALAHDAGSALALFRLGSLRLEEGDPRGAIPLLEAALEAEPEAGGVRAALARAWNSAGDRARATAVLRAGGIRAPTGLPSIEDPIHFRMTEREISSPRLLARARAARAAGRFAEAESLYRDIAGIRPRDAGVLAELGAVLDQRGRSAEAEPLYRDAVALDPAQPLARFGLGVLRAREGDLAAAEYQFRSALAARPEEPRTYAALGGVLLRQRHFQPALEALQRAAELDPDDGQSPMLAAVALAELARYAEAWTAVHLARDRGAEPPESFLSALRAKLPEPAR